jgi:CRP-like cAMP-binding protein
MLASDSKELDNRDKMLNRLDASSHPIVGEMVLFEEVATRSATLKALEDVTFGVLDKENLLNLVKANPHLGYKLFYNIGIALCTRLNKANRDILKLTTAFTLALEKGV